MITSKCDGIRTQPSRPVSPFIRPCKGFNSGTRGRYASHYISTTCHSRLQSPMSSLVPYRNTLSKSKGITLLILPLPIISLAFALNLNIMYFYMVSCSRHSGQIYGAYSGLFTLSLRVVLQDTLRLVYSSNTDYFAVRLFICWQSVSYKNTLRILELS